MKFREDVLMIQIALLKWLLNVSYWKKQVTGFNHYEYLGKTSSNPSTNNNWMHMYLATGGRYEKAQQLDHNEEIELYFLPLMK